MMKLYQVIIFILLTGIFAAGCTPSESEKNSNTDLKIYTSLYPIQYAVERIGNQSIETESVYPPGVDAHTYEPSSREMTSIAEGDAFIYLGAGMEGFAETAAQALDSQDIALIELGEDEKLFHDEPSDNDTHDQAGHHHDHNPHIWLDPVRMIDMADTIKDRLIDLNPKKSGQYTENFNALKDDLLTLDEQFRKTLETKKSKKILVSHAAYGYWEEHYGIKQIAISGLSSSEEPSQKDLTKIIDQARKYNMDYILFEQNTSDHVSEIIQNQIGAKSLSIHNLAVLTDADIENGEDYLSLMNHNLEVLDQATE